MRKSKVLMAVVAFVLVAVVAVGCSGSGGDGNSDGNGYEPPPPDTPKLPKSGEWTVSVEFGEFVLTVNPSGTGISKISYYFPLPGFECGGIRRSGGESIERSSPWLITDGQFIINNSLDPWDMVIQGEFDETGTHASGTWEITGTTCSGTWESSPAS